MSHDRYFRREMSRRDFLWLSGIAGAAVTLPQLTGCATDPITGKQVVVGLSEEGELASTASIRRSSSRPTTVQCRTTP